MVSIGICQVRAVADAFKLLWSTILKERESGFGGILDLLGADNVSTAEWSSVRYCLVLSHTVGSSWLRPMLAEFVLED